MPKRHYILYCDESSGRGSVFSNFYGGALIRAQDRESIEAALVEKKEELNLTGEIKWTKVTEQYSEKYIQFIDHYFDFVATARIKVRIMFTQNRHIPVGLTREHYENQYFILYYHMIKHAFGLAYSNPNALDRVYVSIFLDEIPHNIQKKQQFRDYLHQIQRTRLYQGRNIFIPIDQIAGVDSKQHAILQGLDVVLGAMNFRLNRMHKKKPEGQRRRAKRTRAKELVYKHINRRIREIYPSFNIGVSTGTQNGLVDRWAHPYRHWLFKPGEYREQS